MVVLTKTTSKIIPHFSEKAINNKVLFEIILIWN